MAAAPTELGTTKTDERSRFLVNLWYTDGKLAGKRTINEDLLESATVFVKARERKVNRELIPQFNAAELKARQRGVGLWRTCPLSERNG